MKERKKGSAAVMLVLIAYLLLPLVVTIVYSLFDKWTGIVPRGFSVKSYVELFQDPEFLMCILRSLIICVVPIVLTTVIILLAMFVTTLSIYHSGRDPVGQYSGRIRTLRNISVQSYGDVVWCIQRDHHALYLPGNQKRNVSSECSHTGRSSRDAGLFQNLCIF